MKIALGLLLAVSMLAQNATDTPEAHVAAAKAAAGEDYQNLSTSSAPAPAQRGGAGVRGAAEHRADRAAEAGGQRRRRGARRRAAAGNAEARRTGPPGTPNR